MFPLPLVVMGITDALYQIFDRVRLFSARALPFMERSLKAQKVSFFLTFLLIALMFAWKVSSGDVAKMYRKSSLFGH